jgi:hypothetical protein
MPASRVLLVLQEGQEFVVDVPGAFLLCPVPAVGEQDDPARFGTAASIGSSFPNSTAGSRRPPMNGTVALSGRR